MLLLASAREARWQHQDPVNSELPHQISCASYPPAWRQDRHTGFNKLYVTKCHWLCDWRGQSHSEKVHHLLAVELLYSVARESHMKFFFLQKIKIVNLQAIFAGIGQSECRFGINVNFSLQYKYTSRVLCYLPLAREKVERTRDATSAPHWQDSAEANI